MPEQKKDVLPDDVDLRTPKRVCAIWLKFECKAMRVLVRLPRRVAGGPGPTAYGDGRNVSC